MNKSRLEIKVGLFVCIALALLAVLVIQFSKGTSAFRKTYTLKLHAVNVGGLKERASVLLAGVQVGAVKNIELASDGKSVTIFLQIYKDSPIYGDARFVIEQAGFLGDQYVSVLPTENKAPPFTDGADVECQEPFDLQEVARGAAGFIKRMDETAKKLDDSVTDLRAQVLNAQTLSTFGVALTNMQKFTAQALGAIDDINVIVATNTSQVTMAVSNLVYFSSELNQLGSSAQDVLATNSLKLNDVMKNLDDVSVTVKQLAADVQGGRGLAGTVLQNQELATNVQLIAANLAVTTSNLNRTGLWGILWSHKAPVTNQPAKK
ncbi:MAG TPA: MlaD family protein [Candidatus Sulfotelmatobacter sp.]|jgi:phospholipid/cholesterol/gamma-HCH transport system substrate-binding protein|nr:MlaD family protein [Candidatus Sulfotelmatobacter sp.]